MPNIKEKIITIPKERDIAQVYGILSVPLRKGFRAEMLEKHGIPESSIFRFLRTNQIPLIKRNAMVLVLNTYLKELGYVYGN